MNNRSHQLHPYPSYPPNLAFYEEDQPCYPQNNGFPTHSFPANHTAYAAPNVLYPAFHYGDQQQHDLRNAAAKSFTEKGASVMVDSTHFDQPVQCVWAVSEQKVCGYLFTNMPALVEHIKKEHVYANNTQLFVCYWKDCKRKRRPFKARYKLVNHMRVHSGERPFVCTECLKRFGRSENLKIHIRIHTGEKPFACPYKDCDRYFGNSSDRKKHSYTHKTNEQFFCKYKNCNRSYRHPSSHRKHLKMHEENGDPLAEESLSQAGNSSLTSSSSDNSASFSSAQGMLSEQFPSTMPASSNTIESTGEGAIGPAVVYSNPFESCPDDTPELDQNFCADPNDIPIDDLLRPAGNVQQNLRRLLESESDSGYAELFPCPSMPGSSFPPSE